VSEEAVLPSWRQGATRDSILEFVRNAGQVDPAERVAVFDNDGTLWCEKPEYPQLTFFVDELRRAATDRPALRGRPEYGAVLEGDREAIGSMGLPRVAMALVELFESISPEEFTARVDRFFAEYAHPDLGVPHGRLVYAPMIELIDLLRGQQFRVFIGTAGGADFVRAVSERLYGVPPERVIGSRVSYGVRRSAGSLDLIRTAQLEGEMNEGMAKIPSLQRQIGQRPICAAGNSPGDAEMLEFATRGRTPSLAVLVNHDDGEREYAYESTAGTFEATEPVLDTAERLGWTVVSMKNDWTTVFGP
jgi:hypothetical protein